jgi:predicted metal-dependent hydrolase
MQKQINLNKKKIEYTLRLSRKAGRLRLAVYSDGRLVVTAPQALRQSGIESFILQKSKWLLDKLEFFRQQPVQIFTKERKKDYYKHRAGALKLVKMRLEYFNRLYAFKFNRISIRNQKTRWGSCSQKGNLNFNYKIVFLPEKLADYLIVHELCHLRELNHSRRFWDLVARAVPDYKSARTELKKIKF